MRTHLTLTHDLAPRRDCVWVVAMCGYVDGCALDTGVARRRGEGKERHRPSISTQLVYES